MIRKKIRKRTTKKRARAGVWNNYVFHDNPVTIITLMNVIHSLQTRNKRQGGETKEQIEEQEWREGK